MCRVQLFCCVVLAACGGPRSPAPKPGPAPLVTRTLPASQVFVLQTSGTPPGDTTATLRAGVARTVILLHGPPDNLAFAELYFPANAFRAPPGSEVRVTVRPRPGVYGVDVGSDVPLAGGAHLRFKYPRYFSAPAAARQAYGGDIEFERALQIGRVLADGNIALQTSVRPASDNLQSALPATGSYVVAAPR